MWLRPKKDVTVQVTLLDAVGRELLDESGPGVSWETQPNHIGIEYKATDRLFVETDPEYEPETVPVKYFQVRNNYPYKTYFNTPPQFSIIGPLIVKYEFTIEVFLLLLSTTSGLVRSRVTGAATYFIQ